MIYKYIIFIFQFPVSQIGNKIMFGEVNQGLPISKATERPGIGSDKS